MRALPRRLQGRDSNDGLVQLWRYRWLIIALLTAGVAGAVLVASMFESKTLESGRQEIKAMREDPIVSFRAPGTSLRHQEEHPATESPFAGGTSTSAIRQEFEMGAEAGDTVEAYRLAAEGAGWTFVADGCSRAHRATGMVLGKRFSRFAATLAVAAHLGAVGDPQTRRLLVTVESTEANPELLPVDAGLHRSDVQCLRDFNPSDPDLQQPKDFALSMDTLCSRIPVSAVKRFSPEVEGAELLTVDTCRLVDATHRTVFTVERAVEPPAYYKDRRLLGTDESGGSFLFSVFGKKGPESKAVWVMTPSGPYVVRSPKVISVEDESPLFALARVLGEISPQPTTLEESTTTVPKVEAAVLVEYRLDGGLAGPMRVVVTTDAQAIYTAGSSEGTRFAVGTDTMEELRRALAGVDFEKLRGSYGSASGPDRQVEVIAYRGKTVRIASGAPEELRRVTAVLDRLLDEGRRRR